MNQDSIPFSSLWTSRTVQGELEDAFSAVLFNWPVFTPARFNHLYSLSSAVYNKRLYQQASDDDEGTQDKSPATGNYRMDLTLDISIACICIVISNCNSIEKKGNDGLYLTILRGAFDCSVLKACRPRRVWAVSCCCTARRLFIGFR